MRKAEYVETMKVLFPDLKIDDDKTRASIYGLNIYLGKWDSNISGKIPYEFAEMIYEKYPCESLDIKVGNIGLSSNPIHFVRDDIYKNEVDRNIRGESSDSRVNKLRSARKTLQQRTSNKYIERYRIGTKEGLAIILSELKKYYAQKEGIDFVEEDIKDVFATINTNILMRINPTTTNQSWMMQSINAREYFASWNKTNSTASLQEFRRTLDELDRTINPFLEKDLSIEEIIQDLKDMTISVYPFDYGSGFEDNLLYYEIIIQDVDVENKIRFGINPAGFFYSCTCKFGEQDFFLIQHFYDYSSKEEDKGEIVTINYFGDNSKLKRDIRYNITKGTVTYNEKQKVAITELQLATIYFDLVKAIQLAANLTINNLSKNNKTIQMTQSQTGDK